MARKSEDPLELIKADITQKFQMACIDTAANTTFLIQSAYERVIDSFYDEYTPRSYKRTFSTYKASDRADDLLGYTPIGDFEFDSGITVDSENIMGNPYRADKDWVFDRTFRQGIHGFFKWEMKQFANKTWKTMNKKYVMSKKRKARLEDFLRKSIDNSPRKYRRSSGNIDLILSMGSNASEEQQSLLKYHEQSMRDFSSTPEKTMNAAFKRITAKKNMDALFQKSFEKYFPKE